MKNLKLLVVSVTVFLLIIGSVLFIKQYDGYKKGLTYEKKGLYVKAIDNYAMTVYMHIPFSPFENKAINHMLNITKKFKDNVTITLYCLERLRSSIYGTGWLFNPHKKILQKIEPEIASIKAKLLIKDGYKKSYNATYKELINIMETNLAPKPFLALLAVLLFVSFMLTTVLAIIKSSSKTNFSIKTFVFYLPIILILWALWLITLYKA